MNTYIYMLKRHISMLLCMHSCSCIAVDLQVSEGILRWFENSRNRMIVGTIRRQRSYMMFRNRCNSMQMRFFVYHFSLRHTQRWMFGESKTSHTHSISKTFTLDSELTLQQAIGSPYLFLSFHSFSHSIFRLAVSVCTCVFCMRTNTIDPWENHSRCQPYCLRIWNFSLQHTVSVYTAVSVNRMFCT